MLGPWESTIQLDMARLGFVVWDDLTRENRQQLLENIRKTAQYQSKQLLKIAEEQGRLVLVCFAVKGNDTIDKTCTKIGIK